MSQPLYYNLSKMTQENPVQEFSIEIPDIEADEIQTVQQGKRPSLQLWRPAEFGSFSNRLYCKDPGRSVHELMCFLTLLTMCYFFFRIPSPLKKVWSSFSPRNNPLY